MRKGSPCFQKNKLFIVKLTHQMVITWAATIKKGTEETIRNKPLKHLLGR